MNRLFVLLIAALSVIIAKVSANYRYIRVPTTYTHVTQPVYYYNYQLPTTLTCTCSLDCFKFCSQLSSNYSPQQCYFATLMCNPDYKPYYPPYDDRHRRRDWDHRHRDRDHRRRDWDSRRDGRRDGRGGYRAEAVKGAAIKN